MIAVRGSLQQWRMRAAAGVSRERWMARVRLAGYAYTGDSTDRFKDVPMRGALVEDDLPGLAGALQSLSARAEVRFEAWRGGELETSYGYIAYAGPVWSSAHLLAASASQRLGRFRVGFGLVYEHETDARGAGYPTLFGTGTVAASF